MSARSWPLYIFHYTTLAYAAYFMKDMGIPAAVQYLICTVAAFAGAYLLGEIISRIPVVRFWVLGIRGKKKAQEETHVQG
jgi:peptidoglycan/LPS O-acetylase OafA/YrhL